LFYPAEHSSISQATMIDAEPERAEQNMARWTFAGSLGVVVGPLALGLAVLLGSGWRGLYLAFALLALILWGFAWRMPLPPRPTGGEQAGLQQFAASLRTLANALRRGEVLRCWSLSSPT
jgi:FSR family fosmidomycin resistance protein-like MFS transporter